MDIAIMIVIGIFAVVILFGIIKKVIKAFIGILVIIALVCGGLYVYNAYPTEVKNFTDTVKDVFDNTTVKDYLRVDAKDKYYVYVEEKDANGNVIKPTGRIFDYPEADITLSNIVDVASGHFKGFTKQYYKIDKDGNPIVPDGGTAPRKFVQPKLRK